MKTSKLQEVRSRIEQAEQENERLRAKVKDEEDPLPLGSAKTKPRRPRLKNVVRAAAFVSQLVSKKIDAQHDEDDEDQDGSPNLFLKGLKKQSELNDEQIEVVERFGLKCKVKLVQCGRTLIVDVHTVRYADNSRWDGLTDEIERNMEDRTKKEMLAARMREGNDIGEETEEIKDMMGIGPKVHTESLSGPHSLSGRSQGSVENDEEDDKPEEQESSDDEANHPKPLRKGVDQNGGYVVRGDVDLELIFDYFLNDITHKKTFKQALILELMEAVEVRASKVKVLWLYSLNPDRASKDFLVARLRLGDGLSRSCRSSADVARALWFQQSDPESNLKKGKHMSKLLSLRVFIDPDTEDGRRQLECSNLREEHCRRSENVTVAPAHDNNEEDLSVLPHGHFSRLPRLSDIRDLERRGTKGVSSSSSGASVSGSDSDGEEEKEYQEELQKLGFRAAADLGPPPPRNVHRTGHGHHSHHGAYHRLAEGHHHRRHHHHHHHHTKTLSPEEEKQRRLLAQRIGCFYRAFNASKVDTADEVAMVFLGKEDELNEALMQKYQYDLRCVPTLGTGQAQPSAVTRSLPAQERPEEDPFQKLLGSLKPRQSLRPQPFAEPAKALPAQPSRTDRRLAQPILPSPPETDAPSHIICDHCGKSTTTGLLCAKCKVALFCSRECQVAAWKSGHKQVCQVPASPTSASVSASAGRAYPNLRGELYGK